MRIGGLIQGKLRETLIQGALFSLIGALNTSLHYLVYRFLIYFGVQYLLASAMGYSVGLVNSFLMNKKLTFRMSGSGKWRGQFIKFLIVNGGALLINLTILTIAVNWYGLEKGVAVLPAIAGSMIFNFLGNKLWTFRPIKL